MSKRASYKVIDHPDSMRAAVGSLSGIDSLALDLEMENNYHHYGLHIALIQISAQAGKTLIFDPLSGIDVGPIGTILADPSVELVIHDSGFDKRACRRIYGWELRNIFDTKVAAQLCGIRRFGLAALLSEYLGVETTKKFQRIDWLKRPLHRDALHYAAVETCFLFRIRDILTGRLVELGRLEWAREEFARLEDFSGPEDDAPAYLRIKGSSALDPRQLAVLESLAKFRDLRARQLGRPVHFVVRNKTLLDLAVSPPRNADELRNIRGLHPSLYRSPHARSLMEAIDRGLKNPEVVRPASKSSQASRPGYVTRLKAMQRWRARAAADLEVEPHILLSNDVLEWCAKEPGRPLAASVSPLIRRWQRRVIWDDFRKQFGIPGAPDEKTEAY